MQWDQIRVVNLNSKLENPVSMGIISGMGSSSKIKNNHNTVIIIKTKTAMNMLNIAKKEMKRIFLMIFSIKKTKDMNQWNSSKRTIRNIASTIQTSKNINKKRI